MSNVIYKKFYTYQYVDGDLVIYTWEFLEDWGDQLAYINKSTNNVTWVHAHQDPKKFEHENDVWLDELSLVSDATGSGESVTFEFDEFSDEGRAWFENIYGEKSYLDELNEFYDLEDGDDEEVEQYYKQTMNKEDEGDE